MAKRRSTKAWLAQHKRDPYVRRAQAEDYRSRAAFKLAELDAKDGLLEPGRTIVDLGAAPGGWSQYCRRKLGDRARIVGIDLLPIEPLEGVRFLQADFAEQAGLDALLHELGDWRADLVLSDMAPNMSGVAVADQMRAMHLAELALDFCGSCLQQGGDFVVKTFQGEGFDDLLAQMRRDFRKVHVRKPGASKDASREVYLVGRGWRGGEVTA